MRTACTALFVSTLIILLFTVALLFVPEMASAETVKCYSNGQKVYDQAADYVEVGEQILTFVERKTGHQIYFFNFDCMVISDDEAVQDLKGEKVYAA